MRILVFTALVALSYGFPKKFDPFFNPYDKFDDFKDPCQPKCVEHKPECKSPCELAHPQTISVSLDPSSFASKFAHQPAPKAQVIHLAPPIAKQEVEVILDGTIVEEHPFPTALKPTFKLESKLQTCKDKLPKSPCEPHPWCYHDRKDHFYHETCYVDCPCPFHIWGQWCCDSDFACLAPYEKWDIAKSFGKGHGKSFSGYNFDCDGGYGGGYGSYGGYQDHGFGGFHGGYACGGGHFWKK